MEQKKFSDGRISLYLEYYLGREEKPVLDENGNQVYYDSGKMQGKPKFAVKHNRRKGFKKVIRYAIEHDVMLKKNCLIFDLPIYESCCKSVKHWVKRAGIDKHISWHCARHSFAVNILNNGANIKTVASLSGHSGLKHTEKNTRAVDKLKEEAINNLPELKF